ncbi:GD20589 [Drosophila simulans]|uniref:GD20589 n=1 Tax=Drosophila simulans TaxID=7240 RepID=B4QSZ6_DROSI|nr:GD20589 [Drosophila simulans]
MKSQQRWAGCLAVGLLVLVLVSGTLATALGPRVWVWMPGLWRGVQSSQNSLRVSETLWQAPSPKRSGSTSPHPHVSTSSCSHPHPAAIKKLN